MSDAPLMLGVSGLRGIMGESLTADLALRYAATLGTLLTEHADRPGTKSAPRPPRVVIGLDGRPGGEALYDAASAGLKAAGCHVLHAHIAMTATLAVLVDHAGADAGLQITASHNPQEWNGLKILLRTPALRRGRPDACAPPKSIADEVARRFRAGTIRWRSWADVGTDLAHLDGDAHARAVADTLEDVGALHAIRKARFRILLDSVNGAGGIISIPFLRDRLRCRVVSLGEEPGVPFWHVPEPTASNLKPVRARARRARPHAVFGQDPDADRLAILDETARYLGEEYTLALAALALGELGLIRRGDTLAANLSTSRMIDDVAHRFGARVVRTPVGEANVVEAMKREGCVLGGEGNGGVIWPRITFVRDSLSAMALVLALMARAGEPLSELVRRLPAYAIEKRRIDLPRRDGARPALERLRKAFAGRPLDEQDGVRVEFDHAWLHVRPSNTEPILRLIAEAPEARLARALLDDAARALAAR